MNDRITKKRWSAFTDCDACGRFVPIDFRKLVPWGRNQGCWTLCPKCYSKYRKGNPISMRYYYGDDSVIICKKTRKGK